MTDDSHGRNRRALDEGAERSRAAARPDEADAPAPPPDAPLPVPIDGKSWHLALWHRHKWKIVSLLILLLTELCLLMLGRTLAMGPG